jgi:hypothetical protein
MKYIIDVADDKAEAFQRVLDGLRKLGVIEQVRAASSEVSGDSTEGESGNSGQREKTARDFVEQYRDLVD